jgi:hypothetical protein
MSSGLRLETTEHGEAIPVDPDTWFTPDHNPQSPNLWTVNHEGERTKKLDERCGETYQSGET